MRQILNSEQRERSHCQSAAQHALNIRKDPSQWFGAEKVANISPMVRQSIDVVQLCRWPSAIAIWSSSEAVANPTVSVSKSGIENDRING
jgi:hypothetical protein